MAVFRVERTHNYTVMSNYHLRDKSISLKAKGLLSLMLSLPETWDYTLAGLARISLEGKDAIRAAVVELEKAGYIHRSQTTDKAGKFGSNEYIIREYPASHEPPPEGPSSPPTTPAAAEPLEAKGRRRSRSSGMSQSEMDAYRELIRENIGYDDFVRERPYDAGQLDEMLELMVEAA